MDYWSNEVCLGYIIKAMKNLKMDKQIQKVLDELFCLFDEKTLYEAEQYYKNYSSSDK